MVNVSYVLLFMFWLYVLLGWCQHSIDKTQVFWKTCSKKEPVKLQRVWLTLTIFMVMKWDTCSFRMVPRFDVQHHIYVMICYKLQGISVPPPVWITNIHKTCVPILNYRSDSIKFNFLLIYPNLNLNRSLHDVNGPAYLVLINIQRTAPTQRNSSCSHCAVTRQWQCGDYPLTY